ncbi:F0F1 ATP synthase subunit B family protein [Radicibacter daui]|uniref:F0F1 ATP synthase subunit B family protein n=1 Tax=Radicibacter daui TaxID=3064829 RepID=UPI00404697CB
MTEHLKAFFRPHFAVLMVALLALPGQAFAEGGEEGGLPQLNTHTYGTQIFWGLVLFVVLYLLMSRVALPRVGEVLEERSKRITGDLERAQQLRAETEALVVYYEEGLAKARAHAGQVISGVNHELSAATNHRLDEVGKALAKKIETAEKRIAKAQAEAMGEVRNVAVDVAATVLDKLVGISDREQVTSAVDRVMGERA